MSFTVQKLCGLEVGHYLVKFDRVVSEYSYTMAFHYLYSLIAASTFNYAAVNNLNNEESDVEISDSDTDNNYFLTLIIIRVTVTLMRVMK